MLWFVREPWRLNFESFCSRYSRLEGIFVGGIRKTLDGPPIMQGKIVVKSMAEDSSTSKLAMLSRIFCTLSSEIFSRVLSSVTSPNNYSAKKIVKSLIICPFSTPRSFNASPNRSRFTSSDTGMSSISRTQQVITIDNV